MTHFQSISEADRHVFALSYAALLFLDNGKTSQGETFVAVRSIVLKYKSRINDRRWYVAHVTSSGVNARVRNAFDHDSLSGYVGCVYIRECVRYDDSVWSRATSKPCKAREYESMSTMGVGIILELQQLRTRIAPSILCMRKLRRGVRRRTC